MNWLIVSQKSWNRRQKYFYFSHVVPNFTPRKKASQEHNWAPWFEISHADKTRHHKHPCPANR